MTTGAPFRAADASNLDRQIFGRGNRNIGASFENSLGLDERKKQHA
jgi:hypothetical protein